MFRTRQAPSPTGYLHFGTCRQVLFTKLFALKEKGQWFLRIEDTDRKRLVPDAVKKMLEPLDKLGLLPDEGVTIEPIGFKDAFYGVYQKGDFGPYIQSERLKIYHEHAQKMLDQKLAYWSFLTEADKEDLVVWKAASKKAINYFQVNQERFGLEDMFMSVEKALTDPREPALRYRLQREQIITCYDELMGATDFDLSLEEDFTILKSDGYPTYHFAHLIDDHLMQTTLVIRGFEWFASLPKHVTMFLDYWGSCPKYLHLPVILGETGNSKMSKRDGNVNMQDYLDQGYLPEAILNYLAFLGWNPGTEQELFLDQSHF